MHSSILFVFSVIASALAIAVSSPVANDLYGPRDSIPLKWTSVSTDPTTFSAVMVNPSYSYTQSLAAQVNTKDGTASLQPPSGGFPLGKDYQINLMGADGGILAQSGKFEIGYSTSSSSMMSTAMPTTMTGMVTNNVAATATATDANASNVNIQPTGVNSAFSSFQISAGLVASAALLHALAF